MKNSSNTEQKFSFYKAPVTNVNPYREITLEDVYQVLTGHYLKYKTQILRRISDKGKNREFKSKSFSFVTFSGTFAQRKEEALKKHSGFLVLDFDHIETPSKLKLQLLKDKYFETDLIFTSPNGNGLKWVVSIEVSSEYGHGQNFDAINRYIQHTYQIEVDKSGRDVSRVCFLCYDPEAFLHPRHGRMIMHWPGEIFTIERKKFNPSKWLNQPQPNRKLKTQPIDKNLTRRQYHVEVILRRIENVQIDLTCNYNDWRNLGWALIDEFGETGRNYFHRLSKFHPEYDPVECDKNFDKWFKYDKPKGNKVRINSFFQAAKDAGINIHV